MSISFTWKHSSSAVQIMNVEQNKGFYDCNIPTLRFEKAELTNDFNILNERSFSSINYSKWAMNPGTKRPSTEFFYYSVSWIKGKKNVKRVSAEDLSSKWICLFNADGQRVCCFLSASLCRPPWSWFKRNLLCWISFFFFSNEQINEVLAQTLSKNYYFLK